MIIDCHGHYTTAPPQLGQYRDAQIAAVRADPGHASDLDLPEISDDDIRASLEGAHARLQRERGTDLTCSSPGVVDGPPRRQHPHQPILGSAATT